MRPLTSRQRLAARTGTAAFAAVVAACGLAVTAGGAYAATQTPSATVTNPYSPAYGHAYRHGVEPTVSQFQEMRQWQNTHPGASPAASANNMNYGGGIDGIGVTTGREKVYLVFYGSQWGTQGTDGNGNTTLSGDPSGEAPYLQQFFKGLGTGSELWSGIATQYCDGVATGSQTCPASNTEHVAYPTGGNVLSGVWVDESTASPSAATGHQLGVEAVNAAAHFGNTTAAANRDAQYIVISPHGTNPDNWLTNGFCAWHDYNGDSTLSGGPVTSPYGDIAFTNLPYITDAGTSCGQDFVNSNGTLDGVSIVEGHEYNETITDQNPPGGWTNSSGSEVGDVCAWITPGTSGGSFDLTTGTGTFAVQTIWGNDGNSGAGACEASHAIVNNGGANTVTVTNPGSQTGTVGTAVSLQIHATDSASGQTLTYSATGLPAGLSINSSTGLISGTPTTAATNSVTVTAKDTTNASGSASFTWTINSATGNTVTVTNPGSQTGTVGTAASLQIHATDSASGQTLTYSATGLPAGLSINSSTGLISGTPTTAGTYSVTVTVRDTTGATGSASFTWTINSTGGCTAAQLLGNPGFETGSAAPWTSTPAVINPNGAGETAHSGTWYAWLDGYGTTHTDTLAQTVTIPANCTTATFSFWLHIDTAETTTTTAFDTLKVQVLNSSGTVLSTLATFSNLNHNTGYAQHSYSLGSFIGQKITLKFTGSEDSSLQTSFVVDDNALNVH
jgi:Putative Ig domain